MDLSSIPVDTISIPADIPSIDVYHFHYQSHHRLFIKSRYHSNVTRTNLLLVCRFKLSSPSQHPLTGISLDPVEPVQSKVFITSFLILMSGLSPEVEEDISQLKYVVSRCR